jgi:hypothetical protein
MRSLRRGKGQKFRQEINEPAGAHSDHIVLEINDLRRQTGFGCPDLINDLPSQNHSSVNPWNFR